MSIGQLITLMSASVVAAALDDIARDLDIDAETSQLTFSSYYLGLAFGPFLIAPIAEMNGRKNIWFASNIWFTVWNALCPVGKSKGLLISGRLLAALGASAGITVWAHSLTHMSLTPYTFFFWIAFADVFSTLDHGSS